MFRIVGASTHDQVKQSIQELWNQDDEVSDP
jgi:hypothetical protein